MDAARTAAAALCCSTSSALVLGLPVMVMEFAVGAAQASPIYMYQRLEKPGQKWGLFGVISLIGNIALMAFYTVVTGWIFYYFVKFLTGSNADFGFAQMIADPKVNVTYLFVVVVAAFVLLSFNLQGGLERVTKVHDDSPAGADAGAGAAQPDLFRRGGGAAVLSGAGLLQDQRHSHRGGHESGLLLFVGRHGRYGDLRQLYRQGPRADG